MQAENEPALPVKTVVVDAEHYAKLGKAVKTLHHNLSIRTAQVADLKRQNAELKDQCNQLLETCKPASDAGVPCLGGQFIVMRAPAPQIDQSGNQSNSLSQLRSASGGGGAPQTLTALGALSLRRSTSLARRSAVGSRMQGSAALAVPSAASSRRQPAALSSRPSSQGTRPTVSSVGDDLCSLPSGASTPGRCTAEAIPDVTTGCAALPTQQLPVCRVDAPAPPSSGDRTNKLGSRIRAMLSLGSAKRKDQASPHPMTSPRAAQDPQHEAELGSPGLGPLGRNLARMRSQREQQHQHHHQQPPRDYQLTQFQSHPQPLHPVPFTDMQQPDAVTAGTSQHTGLSLQQAPDGAVPVAIQAQVEAMVHKYVTQALHTSPQLLAALTCSKPDPVHMVLGQPTSMASEGEGALERGPMFMGKSQSMTGRAGLQGSFRGSRYGLPHSKPDSSTICADAQPLHANLATTSTPGAAHKPAGAGVQFGTPPRRCEPYPAALTVGATTAEVWQPPDRLSWGSELPAAPLMTAGSTGSASATQLPVPDPAVPLVSRSSAPTAATRQLAASLRASKATDPHLEVILSQLLTPNVAMGQAGSVSLGPASAPILSHSKPTAPQPELLQGSYQPIVPWPAGQAAVQPVCYRPAQADLDSDEVNVGEITVRTSLVQQFLQQCAAQQAAYGLADPACSLPEGAGPPAQSALPCQQPEPASVLGHGRAADTAAPPAVPAQRADMSLTDSLVMFEETLRASHALALAADLHAAGQAADAYHASVPTQHIQPPPSSPPNSPPTSSSCSTAAAASFSLAPHINARAQHPAPSSTTAADSPAESQGSSSSTGGRAAAYVCGPSTAFQPPAQPGAHYSHCSPARGPLPASAAASHAAAPPCELPRSPALHSGPRGCSQTPASNRRQWHHSSPVAAASPQLVVSPGCAIPAPMPSCSPRCARTPKKGSADPAPLSPAALSRQTDSFSSTRSGSLWSGLDHAAQQGSQATAACTDVGGAGPLPDLCPGSDVSPSASPPACTPEALAVVQGAGRAGRAATAEGYRVHSAGIPSASQAGPRQPVLHLAGTMVDDGEAVCGSEEEGYCYDDDDEEEGVGLVPPHSIQSPRASLLAISPTSSGSWEELYCSPAQQPELDLLRADRTCHSPATSCSPCPALPPVVTTPECISGQGSPAGLGWSSGDDGEGCAEDEMDAGLSAEEQHQLQSLTVSIGRARLQAVAGSQPGSVHASHSTSGGSRSSQEVLVGGETASSGTHMSLQRTAATAVSEGPEVQPGAQHTCTAGPNVPVACELARGLDSHPARFSRVGTASLASMTPGAADSEQPSSTPAAAAPAPVPQASASTPEAIAAVAADGPAAPPSPTVYLEASQGACTVQLLGTAAMHSGGEGQEGCVVEAVASEPCKMATSSSLPAAALRPDQAVPTAAAPPPELAVQPAPAALSQQAVLQAPTALPAQAAPGTRPKASALAFWKQREQAAAVQPTAGPIQGSTAPVRKLNVERLLPIAAATSASAAAHAATAFTATKPAAAAVTKPASTSAAKQAGAAATKARATAFSKPAATAKAFAWRPAPGSGAQPVSQADVIAAKDQAAGAQPQDAEHGSTSPPAVPALTSKPEESSPSEDPHDQVEEDPGCQVDSRQPVAPALPVVHQAGPTAHQPAVLTAQEPSDQPMPATAAAELQPTNNEPAVAHTVAAEQATALHSQAVHTTTVASCSHEDPPACPLPSTAHGQTTHQCASESAACKQADGSPCSTPCDAAASSSPCLSQGTSVTPLHANRPRRSSSSQLNSMMRSMAVFDVAAEGSSGAEAAEEVAVAQPVPAVAIATAAAESLELTSPSVASASVLQPQQEEAQEEQQHLREQNQEEQQQLEEKGELEEERLREQEQQQAQQSDQEEQHVQHEEEQEEEEEEQQQPSLNEPGCPPDHPPTAWAPSQPDDSMAPVSICSSPAQSQQGQLGSDSLSLSSLAVSLQAHSAAQDHGPLPAQPHHLSSGGLGVLLVHHNMLYSLKDAEQHTSACSSAQASVTCLDLRPKGHAPGPQHLSAGRHIGSVAGRQEPAVVPNTTALHSPVLDSNHLRKSRFAAGPPAAPAAPAGAVSQPVSSTCASQPGDNKGAMEEAQPSLQSETGAQAASSGASSPSCQLHTVSDLQGIRSPPRGILRLAADLELTQQGDGLYEYDSGDEGDGDVRVGGSMDSQQDEVHCSPGTPDSLAALSASYRTGHSSGSNQADNSPAAGSCSCSVQMFRQARGSGPQGLLDSQLGEAHLAGSAGGAFLLPSPEEQQPPHTPGLQRQANVPRLSMSSSASKQACSSLTLKPCPASPTAATPALVCRPPAMQQPGRCAAAAAAAAAACVLSTPGDSSAATAEAGCQRSGDFRLNGGVEDTAMEAATPPCVPHGLTASLSRPACSSGCLPGLNTSGSRTHRRHSGLCSGGRPVSSGRGQGSGLIHSAVRSTGANSSGLGYSDTTTGCSGGESSCSAKKRPRELVALPFTSLEQLEAGEGAPEWSDLEGEHSSSISSTSGLHSPGCDSHDGHRASSTRAPHAPHHDATGSRGGPHGQASSTTPTSAAPLTKRRLVEAGRGGRAATTAKRPIPHAAASALSHLRTWGQALSQSGTKVQHPGAAGVASAAQPDVSVSAANLPAPGAGHRRTASTKQGGAAGQVACEPAPSHSPRRMWRWGGVGGSAAKKALANEDRVLQSRGGPGPANSQVLGPSTLPAVPQWQQASAQAAFQLGPLRGHLQAGTDSEAPAAAASFTSQGTPHPPTTHLILKDQPGALSSVHPKPFVFKFSEDHLPDRLAGSVGPLHHLQQSKVLAAQAVVDGVGIPTAAASPSKPPPPGVRVALGAAPATTLRSLAAGVGPLSAARHHAGLHIAPIIALPSLKTPQVGKGSPEHNHSPVRASIDDAGHGAGGWAGEALAQKLLQEEDAGVLFGSLCVDAA